MDWKVITTKDKNLYKEDEFETVREAEMIKKYVACIPCRKGSKRIKDKNIRHLADTPLFLHVLRAALQAKEEGVLESRINIAPEDGLREFLLFVRKKLIKDKI